VRINLRREITTNKMYALTGMFIVFLCAANLYVFINKDSLLQYVTDVEKYKSVYGSMPYVIPPCLLIAFWFLTEKKEIK